MEFDGETELKCDSTFLSAKIHWKSVVQSCSTERVVKGVIYYNNTPVHHFQGTWDIGISISNFKTCV